MASTCIDRVLLDLELLMSRYNCYSDAASDVSDAIKDMKFLKTFTMCARKWSQSNDLCLESDDVVKKVSLPSFLTCIEDAVHKYEEDIHSLSLRSEPEEDSHTRDRNALISKLRKQLESLSSNHKYEEDIHSLSPGSETEEVSHTLDKPLISKLRNQIKAFEQEIIQVYVTLVSSRSLHSNSCRRDDELMEFVDLILQNLADLMTPYSFLYKNSRFGISSLYAALSAQFQALEVKLTLLKSFIPFAKLRGTVDIPALLLAHFEVVALNAARLSYMCSFWGDEYERSWKNRKLYSITYEQQRKIRAIDFQVYEIYVEVLRATRSSESLHSTMMDKQILNNFNDSLISCLWDLLCCSSSFMDCMKDEMKILYAGLRFLRSIIREHHEKIDEQNEKVGALLSEAGIIICSPSLNRVKEGEVSFIESTEALVCYDMLLKTNIHIKHFKDQISGSSISESPSFHSLRVQEFSKPSSHMLSKGKIPIAHEVMVGLDDEAEKVIERLMSGPEQVEIVPIVGMAGLGKTTLAKKVYNDSSITHNFHIRLWCTVSQEFSMKSLLTQILCADGKQWRMDEELKSLNEHELLQKLYQRLKMKRYLVVFDDVWDIKVWNELRISFPDDKKRSRILITSRFSNVASQVQYGGKPHNIRPLTVKESFELLQKKVFGEDEECPKALHGFMMEIAKKCQGLPFAVVVVAGILATIEHDISVWEKLAKSLTPTMVSGTDQWKKSLKLSYEHLPYHLKACLLYFAAFREDQIIYAKELVRLWIAEGFVEKIEGKRSEDIAEEYLMSLIDRNLVMVGRSRSIGGVRNCYIHDLVFEFCKTEAKEKNFLHVLRAYDELSTFNESPNLSRLSICSSGEDFIRSRLFCPHLGTLLFFDVIGEHEFGLLNVSFLFCIYKHLKVLNLERINLKLRKLPTEVELLCCLRYLALKATRMRYISSAIAKLSHLETFCLESFETVLLPNSIWNMEKLRHIHVRSGSVVIPFSSKDNVVENLSTLPNLDTLSRLCLCLDKNGESILGRIPNVRRLKIFNDWRQNRLCCNMSRLECLESLTLELGSFLSEPLDHVELSFPMNLKKLHLAKLGLPCSKMSLIEQLPNLEVLKLSRYSLDGKRWELMEGGFPKLRVLILSGLREIVEWTEIDPDSDDYFPCLQHLKLDSVTALEMVPSCLGRTSTLETIEIKFCRDCVKSVVLEIEETQKHYGNENLEIIIDWVSSKENCSRR